MSNWRAPPGSRLGTDMRPSPIAHQQPSETRHVLLAGGLIVLAGLAAYHNSLGGPFTFDDAGSILENSTIRHLWPPGRALNPPFSGGETVEDGRSSISPSRSTMRSAGRGFGATTR